MTTKNKPLSSIANDVLNECAQKLDTSLDELVTEFEKIWKPELDDYSRKLIEYCCSKALCVMCPEIEERIDDGSFGRFTFNIMLAWETPSAAADDEESNSESISKEKNDGTTTEMMQEDEDETALFYSDIMPLLVDHKASVGEDSFVWLGTLVPLPVDVINGRFTFDTLTAVTSNNRLHFPAYDKYLKEIDKCFKHLQNQDAPTGVELADDEFILHVEGTASSQRVIRHIGGTSWPGRLTMTNYALYFEASGVISYDTALKLDLSKDIEHSVKTAATGPWGAPLFDKAMVYESTDLEEGVLLEFPEIASSTRRDHWLALTREIMLLHQFLSRYKVNSHDQSWEMHSRTIMGIIRLHAAREMLRIRPPEPKSFLIFALYEELPKGDYVLQQLSESLKKVDLSHPCSASSILRNMNVTPAAVLSSKALGEGKQTIGERESVSGQSEDISPLEAAIHESREEAREINVAKATAEELKEEGISDSVQVLLELLKPSKGVLDQLQEVLTWQRPVVSVVVITTLLLIIYKEWAGEAIAGLLFWGVARIIQTKRKMEEEIPDKIVVCTASDQTTMESIVSAQHGLRSAYDMVQMANIVILKIHSILIWKAPKHTIHVIVAMIAAACLLVLVPFKYFLMALILICFMSSIEPTKKKHSGGNKQGGNRRLKEWWDSIPVIGVELVDEVPTQANK
ncbi:uncharacterized protein LOC124922063 [Impatiens glandulifera]|uniref:uncharacterized protein LOC124922063 n=1 Tax=Impatiens glandulifera TaxID=253017 RepID=UPI001FB0EA52|nr:uncharacterized protein LOC124922063 [Impatiens glandulifera]